MRKFLVSAENRWLIGFSILFAATAFFFVARVIEPLAFLSPIKSAKVFYFLFLVLGIGTLATALSSTKTVSFSSIHSLLLKNFLAFLPAELILMAGLALSESFAVTLKIAVGWYVVALGFLFLIRWHRTVSGKSKCLTIPQWFHYQIPTHIVLVTLTVGLFLFLGLWRVGHFSAVDEPLWTFDRIPKFWQNVEQLTWSRTRISDKPGITVAYFSGIGLLSVNPLEYKSQYWDEPKWREHYDITDMNAAFRAPLVIVTGLLLLLFFFLIERLTGRTKGVLATILIGTSPMLLGISRIINPDALLWSFVPLSLLSYLVYKKNRAPRFLYLAGIFLGLSLLTKYVSNILFVFFFGLTFLEYMLRSKKERLAELPHQFFKRAGIDFLILSFSAIATMYLFYPALWVSFHSLLRATFLSDAFVKVWPFFFGLIAFLIADYILFRNRIIGTILDFLTRFKLIIVRGITVFFLLCVAIALYNTWTNMSLIDFPSIISAPKTAYNKFGFFPVFVANFYPLLFGVTPIVLVFSLLGIIRLLFRKMTRTTDKIIFIGVLFILFYYLGTTINKVAAMARYQIILYPIIALIAGCSIGNALRMLKRDVYHFSESRKFRSIMVTVVFGISLISVWLIKPFYLAYASSLLPEPYYLDIKDMGTGSFEASEYLNSLPNAKDISVWADKKGVCANFVGHCFTNFDFTKLKGKTFDYVIISAGREKRTTTLLARRISPDVIHFEKYYSRAESDAEFALRLGGRQADYIRIFKFEK
jgi:hypothetical protein